MPESKLSISEREVGDITVVTLTGQILLDDGDLAFGRYVRDLISRERTRLVLDLGEVTYIDSSGIGMLAAMLKTVRQGGGDIRLLHLTRRSQRLFGMMKLLFAFETFDDEETALRSYSYRPGA
jgi:anti-sigma B factor antagonist